MIVIDVDQFWIGQWWMKKNDCFFYMKEKKIAIYPD